MKTRRAPATARPAADSATARLWRHLALVLGATVVVLIVLLVRVTRTIDALAPATAAAPGGSADTTLPRELTPYAALGSFMAESNRIGDLAWTPAQFEAFAQGMRSTFEGRGVPMDEDAIRLRDAVSARVQAMLAAETPDPVATYFRTLRETEAVQATPSGLHYRVTEVGEGEPPRPEDTIILSLTARLPDGTALPTLSRPRSRVVVRDLMPGLAEGARLLTVGGKALIYVPPALAFPDREPPPPIPPGAPIVFFVELHDIIPPDAP